MQPSNKRKRNAQADEQMPRDVRRQAADAPLHGARTIAVVVDSDEDQTTFDAHEDLLIKHSDYFRAALSGSWAESQTRQVDLEHVDEQSFEIFFQFLYSGMIFSGKEGDFKVGHDEKPTRDAEYDRLVRCWILGERLLSTPFKDAVVDAIVSKFRAGLGVPLNMDYVVYSNSPAESCIRRLLIDVAVNAWDVLHIKEIRNPRRFEFLRDVAVALYENGGANQEKTWLSEDFGCTYHEHVAEGKPCCKTMFL